MCHILKLASLQQTDVCVPQVDYLIGGHATSSGGLYLSAGQNGGNVAIFPVQEQESSRTSHKIFGPPVARLAGSHSSIVRCLEVLNLDKFLLISGAEDGRICLWQLDQCSELGLSNRLSRRPQSASRAAPY